MEVELGLKERSYVLESQLLEPLPERAQGMMCVKPLYAVILPAQCSQPYPR